MPINTRIFSKFFTILSLIIATGCSGNRSSGPASGNPIIPPVTANISTTTADGTSLATLSTGDQIVVYSVGGKRMFEVEGTLTDEAFFALKSTGQDVDAELAKILSKLSKAHAVSLKTEGSVGFFSVMLPFEQELFASVKDMYFESRIILNPVVFNPDVIREAKAHTPRTEGFTAQLNPVGGTEGYSGLKAVGAPEFVKQVEAEIGNGVKVNGSDVVVGITDTGITYNHPTFLGSNGQPRIQYMKDYTGEGAVYFAAAAKFEAKAGEKEGELVVNADVIETPKLPNKPTADKLTPVKDLKIKVSPELAAAIAAPGAVVKLGYINEDAYQGAEEKADINANGKLDDKLYIILIEGKTPADDVLYFDGAGTGDFRKSPALGDWNTTRKMVRLYSEKVGFSVTTAKLPSKEGSEDTTDVRAVSIVGFDPGNHGSHVAGIAAGHKTIANDSDDTLARGVAPEAKIALNRVCANNGGCGATEAMIDLARNAGVSVINMSLGGLSPFNDGYGVQETVVNRLTQLNNVLFVISAGNSGPGRQTVGSPSTARLSLSVGAAASRSMINTQYEWPGTGASPVASEDDDFMLFFSSRGPTAAGGFKPNVAAPGTELSSVQLNSAPGGHSGLDVYWGTSMAAPTATGSFALLLDGVRKYNAANPKTPLSTDAAVLRKVLIHSARPFDVKRFDPATGTKSDGQYSWIDEGMGMINLPMAWKLLHDIRDQALPPSVADSAGRPVELSYEPMVELKAPNGIAYDGSRAVPEGVEPAFGTGLYLDYFGRETLRQVNIARRLPESAAINPEAADLVAKLKTTTDEFVLKTVFYGSDKEWLKAGVRDQIPCSESGVSNLTIVGRGVEVSVDEKGKATLSPEVASTLNVCLDRSVITTQLSPGDHGAIILGYRTVGGKVAAMPSFEVPVYVAVPHKTLAHNAGYEINSVVRSFGVSRNYVKVPEGTSVVRVTLEVAEPSLDANGVVDPKSCAGVELMALEGVNNAGSFKTRPEARVSNCDKQGAPNSKTRTLTFSRTQPTAGLWDVHVFGQYRYSVSPFKLKVDYVTGKSSIEKIEGKLAALTGSLTWSLKEASISVTPDSAKSVYELNGLIAETKSKIKTGENQTLVGPLGKMRVYPEGVKSVTIATGGSPGNDIDLIVYECPADLADVDPAKCKAAAQSGGPTDEESASFAPKAGMAYAAVAAGYDIKDDGDFTHSEKLKMKESDKGSVVVTGAAPDFTVAYGFSAEALAASKLANHPLFTSGKYQLVGELVLRTSDEVTLDSIKVRISQ